MNAHMKTLLMILLTLGFWMFLGWEFYSLIGAGIGFVIGLAIIIFGLTGIKNVIIKDIHAAKASGPLYTELNRMVADLAYKEGVPKPEVYAINEFAPHALSVGTSMKTAAIIVTKGLVEALNEDELRAYITHEFAHIKRGDHYSADIGAAMAYIILFPTRLFDGINDGENIGKLLMLFIFGPFAFIFVQAAAYRAIDYDADLFAAKMHGQGFSLASALNSGMKDIRKHPIKIVHYCAHLFTVEPITQDTQAGALFVTHIPTPKRIARLKRFSGKVAKNAVYKSKGLT